MSNIEIEVVEEIWRTPDSTLVVMYPFPEEAIIKGLRGSYNRELGTQIKRILRERGVKLIRFQRLKQGEFIEFKIPL